MKVKVKAFSSPGNNLFFSHGGSRLFILNHCFEVLAFKSLPRDVFQFYVEMNSNPLFQFTYRPLTDDSHLISLGDSGRMGFHINSYYDRIEKEHIDHREFFDFEQHGDYFCKIPKWNFFLKMKVYDFVDQNLIIWNLLTISVDTDAINVILLLILDIERLDCANYLEITL